jgi:hypothetical protein
MKKGTIPKLHQPVHYIAGAMRLWVIIDPTFRTQALIPVYFYLTGCKH